MCATKLLWRTRPSIVHLLSRNRGAKSTVILGHRLREIRNQKGYSQQEIENRTGLLRCYISRVENGHTVPHMETLEKLTRALDVSLYQLFYNGQETKTTRDFVNAKQRKINERGTKVRDARLFSKLRFLLARMDDPHRRLLLAVGQEMASRKKIGAS